jgi:hypothetical protein
MEKLIFGCLLVHTKYENQFKLFITKIKSILLTL